MFGMEGKKPKLFEFDLEKDLMKDPQKAKKILEESSQKLQALKDTLRTGTAKEDYDTYGLLLKAYTGLQKVITKVTKK